MNSCQLCGACSWGPLPNPISLPIGLFPATFIAGKDPEQFVRCDGCHTIADKTIVERDPLEDHRAGPFGLPMLGPPDPMQQALGTLQSLLPKQPETRTERLVRAMLGTVRDTDTAFNLVKFARDIEYELEAPEHELETPAQQPPKNPSSSHFASFTWHDRDTYVQWMLRGLDYAKERMKLEPGVACDFNINRTAKYLADWVSE